MFLLYLLSPISLELRLPLPARTGGEVTSQLKHKDTGMQKRKIKQKYLYPNQTETYLLRSSPQGHLWSDRGLTSDPVNLQTSPLKNGAPSLTPLTHEMQSIWQRVSDANQSGKRTWQHLRGEFQLNWEVGGTDTQIQFSPSPEETEVPTSHPNPEGKGDLSNAFSRPKGVASGSRETAVPLGGKGGFSNEKKKSGVPLVGTRIESLTHALYAKRFLKLAYSDSSPSLFYQLTWVLSHPTRFRSVLPSSASGEEDRRGIGSAQDLPHPLKGKSAAVLREWEGRELKRTGVKFLNSRKKAQAFSLIETVKQLEHRLDTLVYKAGFSRTIAEAKQMINHQYVCLNQVKVNLPGDLLQPGDLFRVQPSPNRKRCGRLFSESPLPLEAKNGTHVLEVDGNTAIYLSDPNQAEYLL